MINTGQKIKFRPTQPSWVRQWAASGGRVFVLVRKGEVLRLFRWSIVNNPTWEASGCLEAEFKYSFNWQQIENKIFGGPEALDSSPGTC